MGHIPKGLNILHKLEMGRYSDSEADRTSIDLKMSAGERSLQVSRFYDGLNRLVHHPVSKDCNELACLIHYDETGMYKTDCHLKPCVEGLSGWKSRTLTAGSQASRSIF